jgi:hypothetical protein
VNNILTGSVTYWEDSSPFLKVKDDTNKKIGGLVDNLDDDSI